MQLVVVTLISSLIGTWALASTEEITKDVAQYQGIYMMVSGDAKKCPSRLDLRLEKNSDYWVLQSGGSFYLRALGSKKKWKEKGCSFSVETDWSPGSAKSAILSEETIHCKGKPKTAYTKILDLRERAVNISMFQYKVQPGRIIASENIEVRTEQAASGYECSFEFMGPPKNVRNDLKVPELEE
ncbi:MAG: hypothetical protein AAF202_02560 [Pseudomonadota bacterium]